VVRKIAIAIGAVIVAAYGWNVLASVIFCFGVRHREFLAFPYLQWIEATSLFRAVNWQNKIWIVTAAIPPSTAVLIGIIALVRYGRPAKPPLYGASQWATGQQMHTGGIRRQQRLS
jgi:hypothetical protein